MKRFAFFVVAASILMGFTSLAHAADLRTLEAVGTVPIDPSGDAKGIPRDNAINQALREAVTRVAQDFLADRWIDDPAAETPIDPDALGETPTDASANASITDEAPDLDTILGKKMVPYTSRFRVIEDRGRRPALFAEDPNVREEYVVIVEVQVDADRIQSKLVAAGLIPAGEATLGRNEMLLEVEGLNAYSAYLAFRGVLEESAGAKRVTPVEMTRGRTVLDVETSASAVEFLELLLTVAPRELEISPVHAKGNRVHVVVNWNPPLDEPQ